MLDQISTIKSASFTPIMYDAMLLKSLILLIKPTKTTQSFITI